MGKSSSFSLKKKRSKKSSQARKRKRSKNKSKRYKSKRAQRREDSLSHSSDDDLSSSVSASSSGSEDDYRTRKRSRSRGQKYLKGSRKKRARRLDSSSESIDDSPCNRKRKGSKKSNDFEGRKKGYLKKPRRDYSVSSMSSGSLSRSTCRGSDDSGNDSENDRHRGRSERKEKERTGRNRSRSFSSCSQYSESRGYPVEEKVTSERNMSLTRRLRSVITVPEGGMEGRELYGDEHKEEMVYDQDDYPSCRSNDSNDGGSKRGFSPLLNVNIASLKRGHVGGDKGEASVSDIRSTEAKKSGKGSEGQGFNLGGTNDAVQEIKSEVSGSVGSLNGDDLESILRQKALENLRRFRGGHPANEKAPSIRKDVIGSPVQQPSAAGARLHENELPKEDTPAQGVERISMPAGQNESNCLSWNDGKMLDREDGQIEFGAAKEDVVCTPAKVPVAGNTNKNVKVNVGSVSNKPNLHSSPMKRALPNIHSSIKLVPASMGSPRAKLVTEGSVDKCNAQTAQTMTPAVGNSNDVNNATGSASVVQSSCPKPTSADITSDKMQDEAKEGSQFEQKKMSVMRGGEMVEVSYKVYIPKKTPALHRRQLKR